MKKLYAFLILLVITLISITVSVSAQSTTDTVYIPGSQSLQISDIINADTSVTAHRVYVLDRGAIYYIDRAFEITHSCKFIAKGSAARPPVLAPAIRADNSSEEWFFKLIKTGISVELNDLYLLSMRSDGKTLGWSRAIHIGANSVSLKLRRVVFDGWTEAGIRVDGADFVKLDVQDCHFRNFIHSTSYYGGQPFLSGGLDHPDTTIFINNTFFSCNSYLFSIRGLGPKSVFEHNSVVYGAVNPLLIRQATNLYINNNLFYAAHAWGGNPEEVIGAWFLNYPDTVSSSIWRIRKHFTDYHGYGAITGPEQYYNDLGLVFDPHSRVDVAHNNDCFFPDKLVKFYNDWNDTVATYDSVEVILGPKQYLKRTLTMARWINDLSLEVLDSLSNPNNWDYAPGVSVTGNTDLDPVFSDAGVVGQLDNLISYVSQIGTKNFTSSWLYELNFPPKWPIPENLVYTNAALSHGGTDGYAVGDLNWFPDQKAQWQQGFNIVVDGQKDAFYNSLTGPDDGYLQLKYFCGNDNGCPYNNADLSAQIWTAWDDTWFYLYEEVKDNVVSVNGTTSYNNDGLELKIDPQPTDSVTNSIFAPNINALGGPNTDSLSTITDAGSKQWARRLTSDGYAIEIAIKWSAITANGETITPAVDNVFGMAINDHDNDGGGARRASVMWAAVMLDAVWNTPKYLGTVKFLADNKLQFIARNNMTGRVNPIPFDGTPFYVNVDALKDRVYYALKGPNDGFLQLHSYAWSNNGRPANDADLSAKTWAAWDDTWFYLYEEVRDDTLSGNATNVWEEDETELKFDAQPTDSVTNSIWDTRLTADQLFPVFTGNTLVAGDSLNNVANADKQWARRKIANGYALELAIKWSAIGHNSPETNESITPAVDNVFGLGINVHDNDGQKRRQASVIWAAANLDNIWNTPKLLGTVKFLADNKLQFVARNNMTGLTNITKYDSTATSVEKIPEVLPTEFSLKQNYPNPFNPTTKIDFSVIETGAVSLKIYNTLGQLVSTIINNEVKDIGFYTVNYNASKLSSGIYIYVLRQGKNVISKKMVLLK